MIAMADNQLPGRRPGDTDLHRRQRTKNRLMLWGLLAMCAVFFVLSFLRMGGKS